MSNLTIDSIKKRSFDAIVVGSGISGGWSAKELTGKGKIETSRFKGLGEMSAAQLKETTMDPATRSLLNTAKLMEGSPVLKRLKELETLEKVTEKIDKITVFGGLDGVLEGLVKLGK